jgi:hypothetical protein
MGQLPVTRPFSTSTENKENVQTYIHSPSGIKTQDEIFGIVEGNSWLRLHSG